MFKSSESQKKDDSYYIYPLECSSTSITSIIDWASIIFYKTSQEEDQDKKNTQPMLQNKRPKLTPEELVTYRKHLNFFFSP